MSIRNNEERSIVLLNTNKKDSYGPFHKAVYDAMGDRFREIAGNCLTPGALDSAIMKQDDVKPDWWACRPMMLFFGIRRPQQVTVREAYEIRQQWILAGSPPLGAEDVGATMQDRIVLTDAARRDMRGKETKISKYESEVKAAMVILKRHFADDTCLQFDSHAHFQSAIARCDFVKAMYLVAQYHLIGDATHSTTMREYEDTLLYPSKKGMGQAAGEPVATYIARWSDRLQLLGTVGTRLTEGELIDGLINGLDPDYFDVLIGGWNNPATKPRTTQDTALAIRTWAAAQSDRKLSRGDIGTKKPDVDVDETDNRISKRAKTTDAREPSTQGPSAQTGRDNHNRRGFGGGWRGARSGPNSASQAFTAEGKSRVLFAGEGYDDDPEWIHRDEVQEMIQSERSMRSHGHVLAATADDEQQHVKIPAATFEAILMSMQSHQQPRGQQDATCRDFLATGSCSRHNCRYTHVASSPAKTLLPAAAGGSATSRPTVQNPFLPKA